MYRLAVDLDLHSQMFGHRVRRHHRLGAVDTSRFRKALHEGGYARFDDTHRERLTNDPGGTDQDIFG